MARRLPSPFGKGGSRGICGARIELVLHICEPLQIPPNLPFPKGGEASVAPTERRHPITGWSRNTLRSLRATKLNVVAGGVEREEQYRVLRDLECDEYQGFYFSPPLPPEEFEAGVFVTCGE